MPPDPVVRNALDALRSRLRRGIHATPLCVAVIGWLCEFRTDPYIADLQLREGQVLLRQSDEVDLEPLCSFLEFLDQVRIICASLHMPESQTQQVVVWAQHRLGADRYEKIS